MLKLIALLYILSPFDVYAQENYEISCYELFKPFIKELEPFGPSFPITQREIVERVLSGEDIQIIDLNILRKNYEAIRSAFPYAEIYSAVKALSIQQEIPSIAPDGGMISILDRLGSRFEVATIEEFRKLKSVGVNSKHIIFTHPDKDALEVRESYMGGVKTFVSDSLSDLHLLAENAPQAKVLIRIAAKGEGSGDNFNDRFGLDAESAKKLLRQAEKLSLQPIGLAFHVGTQSESPKLWKQTLQTAGDIFKDMKVEGMSLNTLSIGGGLPAINKEGIPQYSEYGTTIKKYLDDYFGKLFPQKIIIEPGRGLSGMSGIIIGRVINTKTIGKNYIVTLSVGRFSAGLIGLGLSVNFYLKDKQGHYCSSVNCVSGFVYGKVSASLDRIHIEETMLVPKNLKSGDLAVVSGTGAYAAHAAASNWCGKKFPTQIIFDSQTGKYATLSSGC